MMKWLFLKAVVVAVLSTTVAACASSAPVGGAMFGVVGVLVQQTLSEKDPPAHQSPEGTNAPLAPGNQPVPQQSTYDQQLAQQRAQQPAPQPAQQQAQQQAHQQAHQVAQQHAPQQAQQLAQQQAEQLAQRQAQQQAQQLAQQRAQQQQAQQQQAQQLAQQRAQQQAQQHAQQQSQQLAHQQPQQQAHERSGNAGASAGQRAAAGRAETIRWTDSDGRQHEVCGVRPEGLPASLNLTGQYRYEGRGKPEIHLNADGRGVFEMHGAEGPRARENTYAIEQWWIEADCDGTLRALDVPNRKVYTLVTRFDRDWQGRRVTQSQVSVWNDGRIVILGERIRVR